MNKWDFRFMRLAIEARNWVKGPDAGVGAVIVSPDGRRFSLGYSGLPRGLKDTEERLNSNAAKDSYGIHAELNAILNASCSVQGWTLYCTRFPCSHCAAAMIQAGIVRVVTTQRDIEGRWIASQEDSLRILLEAGVEVSENEIDYGS